MVQNGQKLGTAVTPADLAALFGGDRDAAAYFAGAAEWARFDASSSLYLSSLSSCLTLMAQELSCKPSAKTRPEGL